MKMAKIFGKIRLKQVIISTRKRKSKREKMQIGNSYIKNANKICDRLLAREKKLDILKIVKFYFEVVL